MSKKIDTAPACPARLGKVGGEAVIEGVMMRSGSECSTALRMEDQSIHIFKTEHIPLRKKYKFCNIPIIRGVINFVESLLLSYKILGISANAFGGEAEEQSKFEKWLEKHFGKNIMDVAMIIGTVLGFALAFLLFFYLPVWVGGAVAKDSGPLKSAVESILKIAIFVGYISLVSLMPDIKRVFQYHGAEHKSIFCYEKGEELTVENVKKQRRFHPRCGTSFIFVILILSFVIALFIPGSISGWLRVLCKLLLLPLVVGISFEFLMYAGKHENLFIRILSAPGLWMQRITTKEPAADQMECAIAALKSALNDEFPEFVTTKIEGKDDEYIIGSAPAADSQSQEAAASQTIIAENT